MRSKKAQGGEIMGLLVIIILLIVIIAIWVSLSTGPPKTPAATVSNLESNSLLTSMLRTSACEGTDLEDAIEACSEEVVNACGQDSCEMVSKMCDDILTALYPKEFAAPSKMRFVLTAGGKELFSKGDKDFRKKCLDAGKEYVTAETPIFPNIGKIVLEQCPS